MNVRRRVDNDERLILIMESVQVKRSIFPPAHVHPFSTPSRSLFLFPVILWITSSSLFTPGPARFRDFNFAPSLYPLLAIIIPLPAGHSLISISSRRVENIARVSSYADRVRDCQAPSFVLHFVGSGVSGRKGCANVHEMFAIPSYCSCNNDIVEYFEKNRYLY